MTDKNEPRIKSTDRQGYLIAIEGIDGSGKTTLSYNMFEFFMSKGLEVYLTKEPGDDPIGEVHKKISLIDDVDPYCAALVSTANRYFKQQKLINKIKNGILVISDRYYLSGLAYHYVDGVPFEEYAYLNRSVIKPDMYIFLNVNLENVLKRKKSFQDRWEKLLKKVHVSYHDAINFLREAEKVTLIEINANLPSNEVFNQALSKIKSLLSERWEI